MEKNKLSEMLLSFIIFLLGICLVVWADISSEYEDLSNEIEIYRRHEPWYLHPY